MRISSVVASLGLVSGLNNGVGLAPQMGYNSWYDVMMAPSQAIMQASGDALIATGLAKLGYRYVNVDDGWSNGRFPNGTIQPDPKFPDIGALATNLHSKGLLFGLYGDRGTNTCGGRTGQQGHEWQDADTLVNDFLVDYWKEDSCNAPQDHPTAWVQYATMRDALNKSGTAAGRPVFYSLCGWEAWYSAVGPALGNSFRIGPDDTNWNGVLSDIDDMAALWAYAGPGGWNDACLLLGSDASGQLAVTEQQSRAQFSMWAVLANPMLLSQNVRNLSAFQLATYSNAEVIAVSQDARGRAGQRWQGGGLSWSSADANIPVTLQVCGTNAAGAATTAQQWAFNVSGPDFVSNPATGLCLNLDDCGSDVIAFDCVTTGGTCCGDTCYANEQFTLAGDGTLRSAMGANQCVTAQGAGSQASIQPCTGAPAQKFAYDAATQTLTDAASGKLCLTVGGGGANKTNVWARPLVDGSVALVFLNADILPLDVACGYTSCLSSTGWEAEMLVSVRDLWAHADLGTFAAGDGWNVSALPADGGVAMFVLTPWFNTSSAAAFPVVHAAAEAEEEDAEEEGAASARSAAMRLRWHRLREHARRAPRDREARLAPARRLQERERRALEAGETLEGPPLPASPAGVQKLRAAGLLAPRTAPSAVAWRPPRGE